MIQGLRYFNGLLSQQLNKSRSLPEYCRNISSINGCESARNNMSTDNPVKEEDLKEDGNVGIPFPRKEQIIVEQLELDYLAMNSEDKNKWFDFDKRCYIYLFRGGGLPSEAMAGFDLDQTIIKPKGRNKIPKGSTDWQFFSIWTKQKIEQTIKEFNSRLVIFTNQNGVGLGIVPLEEVQERIELVAKRINIPCTVFVAIEKDEFRKPKTQMFNLFTHAFNNRLELDLAKSFYCGDAVGYPSHSDADITFAKSLGLPFLTPEKFIRGVKPKFLT